jgi:hypothetical protein
MTLSKITNKKQIQPKNAVEAQEITVAEYNKLVEQVNANEAAAANAGGASYKVYTALITQDGTGDPTAIVLENTLGFTPTFGRTTNGTYNVINPTGNFNYLKTFTTIGGAIRQGAGPYDHSFNTIQGMTGDANTIPFYSTYNDTATDGILTNTPFEIRIYD